MGLSVARRWEMCKCAIIQYPSLIPRPCGCKVRILAEVTAKYLLYWPKIQPILLTRKISVRAISGVLRQLSLPSDREALSNYLSYYSDSYFAYPVPLRTDSLAVRRTNPDKYYLVDTRMEMVHRKIEVENVANVEVLPMPIPIPNWIWQHWKLQ